jgi:hypothetical protein
MWNSPAVCPARRAAASAFAAVSLVERGHRPQPRRRRPDRRPQGRDRGRLVRGPAVGHGGRFKIYAESLTSPTHLEAIVAAALAGVAS